MRLSRLSACQRLPPRPEIRHRLLAARHAAAVMRALRHPCSDRPEPRLAFRRLRVKHDAPDVALAVEYVEVVVRPRAAEAVHRGAFESERRHTIRAHVAEGHAGRALRYHDLARLLIKTDFFFRAAPHVDGDGVYLTGLPVQITRPR